MQEHLDINVEIENIVYESDDQLTYLAALLEVIETRQIDIDDKAEFNKLLKSLSKTTMQRIKSQAHRVFDEMGEVNY